MRHLLAAAIAMVACVPVFAQTALNAPVGASMAYELDTGLLNNESTEWKVVYSNVVFVRDVDWLRPHFLVAELHDGSKVVVTSVLDAERQELDAATLWQWSNSTAFFNGDAVRLEVLAAPGSRDNRISLKGVEAGLHQATPRGALGQCGVCVVDDRAPSAETWSGRLFPVGCTGSIICEDSTMISAGHCVSASQVLQFNVPDSTAGCALVNPPVADQFPITSVASVNGGVGADWSVWTCGTNNLGQKPYQRYGQLRRLATAVGAVGNAASIYGYGIDLTCTRNQTQQLSAGSIAQVQANYYVYDNDVRGGNSGSAYLVNNKIVGIVTHCSTGCPGNIATRIDIPALASAINSTMICDSTFSVTFTSIGANPSLAVAPTDFNGNAGGTTAFSRIYVTGTSLTATAPATVGAACFKGWRVDGVDLGPSPTLNLGVTASRTATVVYNSACCPADRDNSTGVGLPDGGVDISDLLYFLGRFEAGSPAADLDNGGGLGIPDGGTDINDLLFFLQHFEAGC